MYCTNLIHYYAEDRALKYNNLNEFLNYVQARDPHQPEFLQAVEEVMTSLWPFIEKSRICRAGLLERLVEPERVINFAFHGWMIKARLKLTVLFAFNTIQQLVHSKVECVSIHRSIYQF